VKALLIFPSTHEVMEAEDSLRELGVEVELVPAPRAISSDCGMCVEVEMDELEQALEAVAEPEAVYTVRDRTYVRLQ